MCLYDLVADLVRLANGDSISRYISNLSEFFLFFKAYPVSTNKIIMIMTSDMMEFVACVSMEM